MMNPKKKKGKKGFTVGELLIVVAIIAVLVAISIPFFIKKVEKAREAHDIYTMRLAASAAIHLYYAGVHDAASAAAAGMSWSSAGGYQRANAYGAYDPRTGKIYPSRDALPREVKTYGKGTATDGGTVYVMGNAHGAYKANEDYTRAVVMVSIYPNANPKHVDIYWKNNKDNTLYVGGQDGTNLPYYSLRMEIE